MRIMKDSGIEWIGKIPKDWEVVPFKAYFTTGKGLSFTKADLTPQGHAVVSYGQVHSKVNTGTRLDDSLLRYIPDSIAENGEASRMNKGDFIFADTSEDLEGCGNCVYVDRDIELYAGYHSVTAKPKVQYDNKFFAYYFQTLCWRSQIRSRVTGIKVYSISQSIINKTFIFVPPLSIQQKIANYLDKVCGEVDELISLQETMIEELKAYKQSVITEAVTKGLNPNVPMKDSGIDWIGEIPEHWGNSAPLKWFVSIILGKMLQSNSKNSDDSLEYYICAKDVHFEGIEYSDLKRMYFSPEEKLQYKVQKGDMLVVEGGAGAAGASIVKKDLDNVYIQNSIMIARPVKNVDISFVYYSLYSLASRGYVDYVCNKATIPHFTKEKLSRTIITFPPLDEQRSIASYLDTKCSEIDSLIALKQTKIEELKEYKKSVIYEYVTGKKEVVGKPKNS